MQLLGAAALVAAIVIHTPASAAADATAQAYRAICTSLLASVMEAAGKRLGEEEALNLDYRMREACAGKVRHPTTNR